MLRGQIEDLMKLADQLFRTLQKAACISIKNIIQLHQITEIIKKVITIQH